jgi:hypothetical protein
MEYTKLGNSGMDVSRICLGCMGFGDAEHGVHKWVLNVALGDSCPAICCECSSRPSFSRYRSQPPTAVMAFLVVAFRFPA